MPAILDRCVKDLMAQGKSESRAHGICVASTGWKRKKGGGWTKKKKGAIYAQSSKARKES